MNEQASCLKEPFKFTTMKYICLEEASRIKKKFTEPSQIFWQYGQSFISHTLEQTQGTDQLCFYNIFISEDINLNSLLIYS